MAGALPASISAVQPLIWGSGELRSDPLHSSTFLSLPSKRERSSAAQEPTESKLRTRATLPITDCLMPDSIAIFPASELSKDLLALPQGDLHVGDGRQPARSSILDRY